MFNLRRIVLTGFAVAVISLGWLANTVAQEPSTYSSVTVFDHEKVNASFAKALSAGGSMILFRRTTPQGVYRVNTQSRESVLAACPTEGCSHEGFTAIVYVVSGAATLVIGGPAVAAKTEAPDKFGGQPIHSGESRRISKGDVIVVPPNHLHWYKNVEAPFRYLEVQTP